MRTIQIDGSTLGRCREKEVIIGAIHKIMNIPGFAMTWASNERGQIRNG